MSSPILGCVTNHHDPDLRSNYLYELEDISIEQAQWSWDLPPKFKNPGKVAKMQALFNKEHPRGTRDLKAVTDKDEKACRKYAVASPPGAPVIILKDRKEKVYA
jgi:hypothetical protein